ncbi:MAG: hypothetical protein AB1349_07590 [Elusimicrobiota bacterium]
MSKTYYELLGWVANEDIPETVPQKKLKEIYSKVIHKIKTQSTNEIEKSENLFALSLIWKVLGDPEKRKEYDLKLKGIREFGGSPADIIIDGKKVPVFSKVIKEENS